jgi:hypothetical protein
MTGEGCERYVRRNFEITSLLMAVKGALFPQTFLPPQRRALLASSAALCSFFGRDKTEQDLLPLLLMFPREPVLSDTLAMGGAELVRRLLRPTLSAFALQQQQLQASYRQVTPQQGPAPPVTVAAPTVSSGLVQVRRGGCVVFQRCAFDFSTFQPLHICFPLYLFWDVECFLQTAMSWLQRSSVGSGDWLRHEAFLRAAVDAALCLGSHDAVLRVLPLIDRAVFSVQVSRVSLSSMMFPLKATV